MTPTCLPSLGMPGIIPPKSTGASWRTTTATAQFVSGVSVARRLVRAWPSRPGDEVSRVDASLREARGDAADVLKRPADEACRARVRGRAISERLAGSRGGEWSPACPARHGGAGRARTGSRCDRVVIEAELGLGGLEAVPDGPAPPLDRNESADARAGPVSFADIAAWDRFATAPRGEERARHRPGGAGPAGREHPDRAVRDLAGRSRALPSHAAGRLALLAAEDRLLAPRPGVARLSPPPPGLAPLRPRQAAQDQTRRRRHPGLHVTQRRRPRRQHRRHRDSHRPRTPSHAEARRHRSNPGNCKGGDPPASPGAPPPGSGRARPCAAWAVNRGAIEC